MKIAYVKIRKDKDPILKMLREILPEDRVMCADISTVVGSAFERMKIGNVIRKGHPGLLIAYGEAAGALMDISIRIPTIMIDPIEDSDEASLDLYKGTSNHVIIHTGTPADRLDAGSLLKSIGAAIEAMRKDVQDNEVLLEKLIEMVLTQTESSPADFDGTDNITDNLRRHRETAELSGEKCPDCGHHMIRFHVSSPAWTWQHLCERAGILTYCPNCKTQHGFLLQIMN